MRRAVTALPLGGAIPPRIRETAAAIQPGAALRNREQAGIWLAASESQIRDDLRHARIEHWYQQGKALRYALVLCRNRLQRLADHFAAAPQREPAEGHEEPAGPPRTLRVLRDQVHLLGLEVTAWQARRRPAERICSLHDLQRFLADPQHAADKEQLDRIIGRAREAGLPPALACVRFRWDTVSGEVERAEVIATEGLDERPATTSELPELQDEGLAA